MSTLSTICGGDNFIRTFQLCDGSIINCMIYDTAGQERFNSLSVTYYKKADAILLVYDISEKSSFDKIKNNYAQKIKDYCKKDIPILLLGNKTDKENNRQVTSEEGIALALQENYEFKESSCLQNINVAGAFENLIERWNFDYHRTLRIHSENNSQKVSRKKSKKNLDDTFYQNSNKLNLNEDFEEIEFNIKKTRTFTTSDFYDNNEERKDIFTLKNTKAKKKEHKKCCK